MMKRFKKIRENKKGFTLVEVIVVLVILAILAAISIPAMTGWIKKANDKAVLVEAKTLLEAAQTITSENLFVGEGGAAKITIKAANDLAKVKTQITAFSYDGNGVVVFMSCTDGATENPKVVNYTKDGGFVVGTAAGTPPTGNTPAGSGE